MESKAIVSFIIISTGIFCTYFNKEIAWSISNNHVLNRQNEDNVWYGAIIVSCLALTGNALRRTKIIEESDGISGALLRMKIHDRDKEAFLMGIEVIDSILSRKYFNSSSLSMKNIVEGDGLATILEGASKYKSDIKVELPAILLISKLLQHSGIKKTMIEDVSLFEILVDLANLPRPNSNNQNEVQSMTQYYSKLFCIIGSCLVTETNEKEDITMAQLEVIKRLDMCKTVSELLARYQKEPAVQQWGVWLIAQLLAYETAACSINGSGIILLELIKNRGFERVVTMMENFPDHIWIQRLGCLFFGQCMLKNKAAKERKYSRDITQITSTIGESIGITKVLVRAVNQFPEETEIQRVGNSVLHQLQFMERQGIREAEELD